MNLSQLARSIVESPTVSLNEEARILRERGEPVIHLGVGEPKNKTPFQAILAGAAKLTSGDVKYTPVEGTTSLRKAIIRYTEENYDRLVALENVIVTVGAKHAIWMVLFTLLNPGDEVIILAPYWVSYPQMVRMCQGVPVIVTPENGTFVPSFEEIERALSSSTKAIIVNSPNNPSGVIYPPELIAQLVDLCERRGIYYIADDIYHKLVFDGERAVPAYQFTQKDVNSSHIIIVNGVAKLYGMTGFRIGWAVAARQIIEIMRRVQSQTITTPAAIVQAAAEGALNGAQSVVEALRLHVQNNREVLLQELKTLQDVRCIRPQGTFYALPDFRAYSQDSISLARFLLRKALVVTVPGREFGMEGHLRISYAGETKDVIEGIARIRWALDPTSPNEIYIGNQRIVRDWL